MVRIDPLKRWQSQFFQDFLFAYYGVKRKQRTTLIRCCTVSLILALLIAAGTAGGGSTAQCLQVGEEIGPGTVAPRESKQAWTPHMRGAQSDRSMGSYRNLVAKSLDLVRTEDPFPHSEEVT